MKLRDYLNDLAVNEATSGKEMDKLVNTLQRAKSGQIKQAGMLSLGFDLRNPANNNESKMVNTLSQKLGVNITEDDLRTALKEVGARSAADIVSAWNRSQAATQQTRTARTSKEGTAGKQQF